MDDGWETTNRRRVSLSEESPPTKISLGAEHMPCLRIVLVVRALHEAIVSELSVDHPARPLCGSSRGVMSCRTVTECE